MPMTRIEAHEIPEYRDKDRGAWTTTQIICAVCSRDFIATHPVYATRFPCKCGHVNHAPEKR